MASVTYNFKPRARIRTIIPRDTTKALFWEERLKSANTGALKAVAEKLSELRYPRRTLAEALAGAAEELKAEVGYIPTPIDVLNYVYGLIAPPF